MILIVYKSKEATITGGLFAFNKHNQIMIY